MIYSITTTLPPQHGGRTKSLLKRNKLITEHLSTEATIITTNYNADYPNIIKGFRDKNLINSSIYHENMYDWLSNHMLFHVPTRKFSNQPHFTKTRLKIRGLRRVQTKANHFKYYDAQNRLIRHRVYYKNSRVLKADNRFDSMSGSLVERQLFNRYGRLHKRIAFDIDTELTIHESFFDTADQLYCEKFYDCDENNTLHLIKVHRPNQYPKYFKTEKQLMEYYYECRFKENDIVFNDARLLDKPLMHKSNKTYNVIVLHSTHLKDNDKLKGSYKYALKHPEQLSIIIVFTEKQKEDLVQRYKIEEDKIKVIPHYIDDYSHYHRSFEQKSHFIYIGRFSHEKQLDHLLSAYQQFLSKGYQTPLVLFGGSDKQQVKQVQAWIDKFNIHDYVTIESFTNQPLIEFSKAIASLSTSQFEGFCLSIMESLAVGTPVVSYDYNYGPGEMIVDGVNGYLVEKNNTTQFADKMAQLMNQRLAQVEHKPQFHTQSAIASYRDLIQSFK